MQGRPLTANEIRALAFIPELEEAWAGDGTMAQKALRARAVYKRFRSEFGLETYDQAIQILGDVQGAAQAFASMPGIRRNSEPVI